MSALEVTKEQLQEWRKIDALESKSLPRCPFCDGVAHFTHDGLGHINICHHPESGVACPACHEQYCDSYEQGRKWWTNGSMKEIVRLNAELSKARLEVASWRDAWYRDRLVAGKYIWAERAFVAAKFRKVLEAIVAFGHKHGHGCGYTCANMAQKGLDENR